MLTENQRNFDGNEAALSEYMKEQDAGDALQARIDVRTNELIVDHTDDPDDMVQILLEEEPEKAYEILREVLGQTGFFKIDEKFINRLWFFTEFIPKQCERLAEEEFSD